MDAVFVTSADDRFALPATVMIRSVLDHIDTECRLDFYILDCGLTQQSRRKMRRSTPRAWVKLHFVPLDNAKLAGFRVDGHISAAAYARLYLGELLPNQVDRAVYLDGDMVALTNVCELFRMDLQGKSLAAVQDPVAGLVGQSAQMMHWENWDVPAGTSIFNSGLLVFDMEKWRREDKFNQALEVARKYPERMRWHDQDALNYVIRGDYLELDPAWNMGPFIYYSPHCRDVVYAPETIQQSINNPKIIHYGGSYRPWKGPGRHWREAEFYRYLHRTAWRNDVYCAPWVGKGNTAWTKLKRRIKAYANIGFRG